MAQELTVEKVIEHHLVQNANQKLTPHLITGLVAMISQNLRSTNLVVGTPTTPPEIVQ